MAAVPLFFPAIGLSMNECIHQRKENIWDTSNENTNNVACTNNEESSLVAYYSVFSLLAGIGWASVRISHFSMLSILAPSDNSRMELNSIGYAITQMGVLCLYGSTWIFVGTGESCLLFWIVGAIFGKICKVCYLTVLQAICHLDIFC